MMNNEKDYKSGISYNALKPLAAVIYSAGANQKDDFKKRVGSTILNRFESGKAEFGAENGSIMDVIQKGYYEYNSPLYQEFMSGKFKDDKSKKEALKSTALAAALLRDTVSKDDGEFFFTADEVRSLKKNKKFDFNKVIPVGKSGEHTFYKYK